MVYDFDQMSPEDLQQLPPEVLDAIRNGQELPPGEAQPEAQAPTEEQGVTAPQPQPEGEATGQEPIEATDRKGDLNVALRQERDRRRQLEEQLLQAQQMLTNPQTLMQLAMAQQGQGMQPMQPQAPELAVEDPDAIRMLIQSEVAPLQNQLQNAQGYIQQLEAERQRLALREQHPDLEEVLGQIDTARPDLGHLPMDMRYYLAKGVMATDPQTMQQQIEAKAKALADEMIAAKLSGEKEKPVTLSGVTPAQGEDDLDLENLDLDAYRRMSPEQKAKIRNKVY